MNTNQGGYLGSPIAATVRGNLCRSVPTNVVTADSEARLRLRDVDQSPLKRGPV